MVINAMRRVVNPWALDKIMTYIFVFLSALSLLIVYFLLKGKRPKMDAIPEQWHSLLLEHVHFYRELSAEDQKKFRQRILTFLNETFIEAIEMNLEELDKILVAASAIIPVFRFEGWHYTNLSSVLLYPGSFNDDLEFDEKNKKRFISGVVGTGKFEHQMILSKKALYEGFINAPHFENTGIHEFVHLIDKLDGMADGVPKQLLKQPYIIPWLKLIHREMSAISRDDSDIRNYGGYNEAEFFAVASEYFFEQPHIFKQKHPDLYKMLIDCFQVVSK